MGIIHANGRINPDLDPGIYLNACLVDVGGASTYPDTHARFVAKEGMYVGTAMVSYQCLESVRSGPQATVELARPAR